KPASSTNRILPLASRWSSASAKSFCTVAALLNPCLRKISVALELGAKATTSEPERSAIARTARSSIAVFAGSGNSPNSGNEITRLQDMLDCRRLLFTNCQGPAFRFPAFAFTDFFEFAAAGLDNFQHLSLFLHRLSRCKKAGFGER